MRMTRREIELALEALDLNEPVHPETEAYRYHLEQELVHAPEASDFFAKEDWPDSDLPLDSSDE